MIQFSQNMTQMEILNLAKQELSKNGNRDYPKKQDYFTGIGIGKRYQDCEQDKIIILSQINDYLLDFVKNIKNGKGLILSGPVGTGKTTILAYIASYNWSIPSIYVHASELDEGKNRFMTIGDRPLFRAMFIGTSRLFSLFFEKDLSVIEKYLKCDLLFLDDFGSEYEHDYPVSAFEDFVEDRYANKKANIITTNIAPQNFNKLTKYRRVIDRWRDDNKFIQIKGESMRKANL